MDFSTAATFLVFSYTTSFGEPPVTNRVAAIDSTKSCMIVAKDMATRFDQQYPNGLFEAQCKDSQMRTFYLVRNDRFGKSVKTCTTD